MKSKASVTDIGWDFTLQPAPRIGDAEHYALVRPAAPTDLHLDGNEGDEPPAELLSELEKLGPQMLRRYPSYKGLEELLAERLHIAPDRLIVTAGGDDAIDRACRAVLSASNNVILPSPTFEMLERYSRLADADVIRVPWAEGPFPVERVLSAVTLQTAAIVICSPNNPTGAVATAADLEQLAEGAPGRLLMIDLAYTEFADEDLTQAALRLPSAVVFRTLSKAWGLAGLRVGYAAGHPRLIGWMRSAGAPYAIASVSVAMAENRLQHGEARMKKFVKTVRGEREALSKLLTELGAEPYPSQGNFVLCRFRDALWVRDALAGLGIAVRSFTSTPGLRNCLRISCPGHAKSFERLTHGLRAALAPQALLFDMDGVLADVSSSYRQAIIDTAATFGVQLGAAEIAAAKREGGANNDWELTRKLLSRHGVKAKLADVTQRFEAAYQGHNGSPGLRERETLMLEAAIITRLAGRCKLGVVTGRPRPDCERFLRRHKVHERLAVQVCMEDGPLKPDPAPVKAALRQLKAQHAWMLGDTVDDIRAARAAGVIPLGLVPPGDDEEATRLALIEAGAARVLSAPHEIEALLG